MHRLFIILLILVCPLAAETKLQFIPNIPVEQTVSIDVVMHQTLPSFKMEAVSKQDFKAILKIPSEQSNVPITQGPVDLVFTLKDLNIDMKINDKTTIYHAKDPAQSVETIQISKIIDRPLRLELDDKFLLKKDNKDLEKILEELPQLNKINLNKVIEEMFVYLFAFANKNLKEGASYTVNLPSELVPGMPVSITYTIDKIENDTVFASIAGVLSPVEKQIENKLKIGDEKEENVLLNMKGKIYGKGQWNVKNALIHHVETDFKASGKIKINSLEWPLSIKGKVNINSQLIK